MGLHAQDALNEALMHSLEVDEYLNGDSTDIEAAYDSGIVDAIGTTCDELIESRDACNQFFGHLFW